MRLVDLQLVVRIDGKNYARNYGPVPAIDLLTLRAALLSLSRQAINTVVTNGKEGDETTAAKVSRVMPRIERLIEIIDADLKGNFRVIKEEGTL